ncbi:MAG: L,D-transpeptidase [Lachnospiraceae bacterium]|nr:L,D-transpeptidase [Lachnospiraceae bacterium]
MLQKAVKISGIIIGTLLALALMIYMYMSVYFSKRFSYGTYVNHKDIHSMNINEANDFLVSNHIPGVDYSNITLLFEGAEGYSEAIKGEDIDLKADMTMGLWKIKEAQTPFGWPVYLFYPVDHNLVPEISYNEDKLKKAIKELGCVSDKGDKKNPVVELRCDENGYYLYDEIVDKADENKLFDIAVKALENIDKGVLELDITECYIPHDIPEKYMDAVRLNDKINLVKEAKITFFDDGIKYTLNGNLAQGWLLKDDTGAPVLDDKSNLVFDENKIQGYTEFLSDVYNTSDGYIDWEKHSGGIVTLKNALPAYVVDKEAEAASIKEELLKGSVLTRRPLYSSEGNGRGNARVGDTYIEVDMSEQKIYYFDKGELTLTSDVVTGNLAKGNGTPAKLCYLYFKQKNRTLRGEGYATFVNYWMAVSGRIGIHDATWRSKFGGNIYKTSGSHGCVNVPKDFAAKLYEVVEIGTPCVMYY